MIPALLTRMSIWLWLSEMVSAASRIEACDPRSRDTTSREASGLPDSIDSLAVAALSRLRAAITTWAPAPARARAVSRPRPLLAPVTTAMRPVKSGMLLVVHGNVVSSTGVPIRQPAYRAAMSLAPSMTQ